jgi:hypothetical protein
MCLMFRYKGHSIITLDIYIAVLTLKYSYGYFLKYGLFNLAVPISENIKKFTI